MFNAEEIIELEKKWFKYKIKQKSKLYIFLLLVMMILSFIIYSVYFPQKIYMPVQDTVKKIDKKVEIKKVKPIEQTKTLVKKSNKSVKNPNIIVLPIESNITKEKIVKSPKTIIKEDDSKSYHFKLEPTDQGSELFSSNGFLTLNIESKDIKEDIAVENRNEVVQPIRETQTNLPKKEVKKQKTKISIDMQEIDTIAYLKDKYYSTSSIVFALMLSEEYYYEKKYKDALKWALTANDIDSQNTKSWYWFAKAKVKLNQNEDAIRALKAYLSNNSSKRLSTLLHKIELGDTDD